MIYSSTMNLVKCHDTHGLTVPCNFCKVRIPLAEAYADLDGKPFQDYYCETCANRIE